MPKPITPLLTVDAVILLNNQEDLILIRRKNPPFQGELALPGGFVDVGETVENACIREAREETNVNIRIIRLIGVFSDPKRDPRGHNVTIAFLCEPSTSDE
ncbi:MAG TPA: NUDIX hydrolase, partial [archaeon]|nr:NUDIX hydrolase [archaeon]